MTSATAAASVFDALGDPNRLQIVIGLCDTGPRSTLQVAQALPLSRQAATKHLEQEDEANDDEARHNQYLAQFRQSALQRGRFRFVALQESG